MEADLARRVDTPPEPAWVVALKKGWRWAGRVAKTRKSRRLRLCETLSLGERRFVAVIEFNGDEFLVGGSGSSFELLARVQEGKVVAELADQRSSRLFGEK